MNREQFRAFRSACRKARHSREMRHNGRRWIVGDDCQRLDDSGCFDRVGRIALALDHAGDARRRMGLKGAARGILSIARQWRQDPQDRAVP